MRRKVIIIALIVLGFIFVAAAFAAVVTRPSKNQGDVTVVVSSGSRTKDIAARLQDAGLIKDELAFRLYVLLRGWSPRLQAGTYVVKTPVTILQLASQLAYGELQNEIRFTVIEGWTINDIAAAVERASLMSAEQFRAAASVHDSREILPEKGYGFLSGRPADATLEGFLFPDTYFIRANAVPAQVIEKMLDNFNTKLTPDLRTAIARDGRTIEEVVILASIVEREVRTDHDRALVADLFLRRLKLNMPLQSDATVNYATGKSLLQPTLEDTKVNSPYNTYQHTGLPPGPIGNPSLSAMKAAIFPVANDYFYYLTAPDGTTIFAKTYEEHLANKAKYLR